MALLSDAVVVISGGGRGIGRGEAIELARDGARVVVNDVDAEAASAVVGEISAAGGIASAHVGDCSEVEAATSLVNQAVQVFGRLDAVVNNAGIVRDRTLAKMSAEEWDAVIAVHLRGHYALTHAACAYWKDQGGPGRIVCTSSTSSTSGLLGNFGQANYGAAKAGIAAFSVIAAQELSRYGVRVNAIAPAARTRMTEATPGLGDIVKAPADPAKFDIWDPANISPLVAYLSTETCPLSAQVLFVQGGQIRLFQNWTMTETLEKKDRWTVAELADR